MVVHLPESNPISLSHRTNIGGWSSNIAIINHERCVQWTNERTTVSTNCHENASSCDIFPCPYTFTLSIYGACVCDFPMWIQCYQITLRLSRYGCVRVCTSLTSLLSRHLIHWGVRQIFFFHFFSWLFSFVWFDMRHTRVRRTINFFFCCINILFFALSTNKCQSSCFCLKIHCAWNCCNGNSDAIQRT